MSLKRSSCDWKLTTYHLINFISNIICKQTHLWWLGIFVRKAQNVQFKSLFGWKMTTFEYSYFRRKLQQVKLWMPIRKRFLQKSHEYFSHIRSDWRLKSKWLIYNQYLQTGDLCMNTRNTRFVKDISIVEIIVIFLMITVSHLYSQF